MMSRRGEDKFPRFRTHVQTQFRTAPDRTSPVPPMASETRPSSSPIAALPTNTTHGHANSHFGLKQSAWHHVVFARASGNCFLGTCPVMRASSRGRCNTIQSVDPTILPPRDRSVRVYSIKTLARMVFRLNQGSQTIFGLLRPCK